MNGYESFETERLMLRPTDLDDASFILELLNSPKWLKYIGDRKVRTKEEASNYIQKKMLPQLEKLGFSNYTVIRKEDGVKVGTCGLYDRNGLEGIDMGFAFLPSHEKKGYAFEAAYRIKKAALETFGIDTLLAITLKDNVSSQNLLTKLRFDKVGTIRIPNDNEELILYKAMLGLKELT